MRLHVEAFAWLRSCSSAHHPLSAVCPCAAAAALAQEPDSEGVRDEQLAALAWANYRARNDSHIVDHFQVRCRARQ